MVPFAPQQSSAASTLATAGADMSRVVFVSQACSSGCRVWMRDYGPRFIDNEGTRAAIDHVYNRPRPVDDAFPWIWAAFFQRAEVRHPVDSRRWQIPLVLGSAGVHDAADRERSR